MEFIIVAVGLICIILLLFLYSKFNIEIEIEQNQQFQGVKLRARLPFYSFEQNYDYTDPNLNLLEVFLIDRMEKGVKEDFAFNWHFFKRFIILLSQISFFSYWEKSIYFFIEKTLDYTVIETFQWESKVGGSDAMAAALHTGLLWAFKGAALSYISNKSNLEHVKIKIDPDFQTNSFFTKISCILKMRIVHIIIIASQILVWKVRWWANGITARPTEQPSH